ncbi:MAG: hypothetical protein QW212_00725 [Nitrososphaerales archaeon]
MDSVPLGGTIGLPFTLTDSKIEFIVKVIKNGGETPPNKEVEMALTEQQKARAAAYRAKIKAAAMAGGYVFKQRTPGAGVTVKKVSKTGKEYYYQPWSTLTEEQKRKRLEYGRKTRELARLYKLEHPEYFQK